MSSEQTFPESDLRSAAQDYKRDAEQKAKWGMGATFTKGRGDNPKPVKRSKTQSYRHAEKSGLFCAVYVPGKAKIARKQDMLADADEYAVSSEDSSSASGDEATTPSEILYGFDNLRVPSHGSQILNTALAKAIEQYEDKETVKLVRNEYEILDADEEEAHNLGHVSAKPKLVDAEDAEYEFV
ncbi:hypothetical protein QM012_009447 [Aureobasidium pullulans]|uniref:Uncharacterized protein n=1 Tax=Aureobasidium pullulans TaxID=5580 RepID=A0ABR0TGV1_AURPU